MSENDVKIYIGKKETYKSTGDLANTFDAVISNRANGNIDKAKALGTALAEISPIGEGDMSLNLKECVPQKFLTADMLYKIKVLIVFACETMLQIEIPVNVLSTTAITAMYDVIAKQSPALYSSISSGAAFSFYYLAFQKGGDVSENVAEAFAMLCEVKNKEGFVSVGKIIWDLAVEMIEKEIEKADFKDI